MTGDEVRDVYRHMEQLRGASPEFVLAMWWTLHSLGLDVRLVPRVEDGKESILPHTKEAHTYVAARKLHEIIRKEQL